MKEEHPMIDVNTFADICKVADVAGKEAVAKLKVVPMLVGQETSLFSGKIDYSKPVEYVSDGPCGFAWISVKPQNKGNTKLGKEERKVLESENFRHNDYEKNYQLWISAFNQSLQKKEAYARAYAKVLRDSGINAYAGSRMD
jgi:hypothetical protein